MTERKKLPPPATTGEKHGTRWRPGQSGNPRGRAQGSRHKAHVALDAIGEANAAAVVRAAIRAATEGDTTAQRIILDRVWPAPKGRPLRFDLPPIRTAADVRDALAALAAATAAGHVSPDEAGGVANILAAVGSAAETAELEGRIAALEQALSASQGGSDAQQ